MKTLAAVFVCCVSSFAAADWVCQFPATPISAPSFVAGTVTGFDLGLPCDLASIYAVNSVDGGVESFALTLPVAMTLRLDTIVSGDYSIEVQDVAATPVYRVGTIESPILPLMPLAAGDYSFHSLAGPGSTSHVELTAIGTAVPELSAFWLLGLALLGLALLRRYQTRFPLIEVPR